jgi:Asp-tRNA(Asn)/Glu-tRNA(Gln) amidotransferase A subunit family amidase
MSGDPPHEAALGGGAVAVAGGFSSDMVHPEAEAAVAAVARTLGESGLTVRQVDGRGIEDARRVWMAVCCYEFARAYEHARGRRHLIAPSVVAWMELGDRVSAQEYREAQARRQEIRRWFLDRVPGGDGAMLLPTTPYPAPPADAGGVDLGPNGVVSIERVGPGRLTCSVNLAGLPALSVPASRSSEGLPIGVSLVGMPNREGTLLAMARRWEEAAGYRPERPLLPSAAI